MREWELNNDPNKDIAQTGPDKYTPIQFNPGKEDEAGDSFDYGKEPDPGDANKIGPNFDLNKEDFNENRDMTPLEPDKEDEPDSGSPSKDQNNLDDYPQKTDNPMDKGGGAWLLGSTGAAGVAAGAAVAVGNSKSASSGAAGHPTQTPAVLSGSKGLQDPPPQTVSPVKVPKAGHVSLAKVAIVTVILIGAGIGAAVVYNGVMGPPPNPNPSPGPAPGPSPASAWPTAFSGTFQITDSEPDNGGASYTAEFQGQFSATTLGTCADTFCEYLGTGTATGTVTVTSDLSYCTGGTFQLTLPVNVGFWAGSKSLGVMNVDYSGQSSFLQGGLTCGSGSQTVPLIPGYSASDGGDPVAGHTYTGSDQIQYYQGPPGSWQLTVTLNS